MNSDVLDPRILAGMKAQLQARQARIEAGEKAIGWKVGFAAQGAMKMLGTDGPLFGFLTDRGLVSSGARISVQGWTKPVAEPEIALVLGSDLGPADRETTRSAVSAVGPAFELADMHFPPTDAEAILAANIYNRGAILGRADSTRAGCDLDGLVGRVTYNGEKMQAVNDPQAFTGELVALVQDLARTLAALGERLRAGEVIITGSIIPPILIEPGDTLSFFLDPIDTIAFAVKG